MLLTATFEDDSAARADNIRVVDCNLLAGRQSASSS